MSTRNTRYWRSFLHDLLSSSATPKDETPYDGVCFFTHSGRIEYCEGCFRPSSSVALDVDPLQILAIFDQIKRQAILDEVNAQQPTTSRQKASVNVTPVDSSVAEHDQTTAHLLSSSKGVSVKKVWLPESNRGYQMLRTMGWEETRGLGPTGDGKMTPIATIFKTGRAGIGVQSTAKHARITHFPRHDEEQAKMAADGRSDAQRMQDRLTRKRKQQHHPVMLSKAQRKVQKQVEQKRDRAIGNELYSKGLEGYEQFLR
ncbi:hypothetical protein BBJ29_006686 [Phytophthora kernoviae]|uniref:G-patch domain-containing protein n=1 Tax=Phytophthora kernoviae TaxID=325452 RepID=A0A3F2RKQ8_9STRA|nr:hypothetical protein BBP00_00006552 [Phytophthora kernoviae]RLN65205.1 hypothetical protein BBJ29_006686 [Phytophthora kernoviae]